MKIELKFGAETLTIEADDAKRAVHFRGPEKTHSQEPGALVNDALENPVEAPHVELALTPDDHITLALDVDTPHPAALIAPLVARLGRASVEPENITVLCTPTESQTRAEQLKLELANGCPKVQLVVHDPADEKNVSYLASTKGGRRLYVHRLAADADALITIGRSGFDSHLGFRGAASTLFPLLSNDEALRLSRLASLERGSRREHLRKRQDSDEAAWLGGLFYSLDVALDRNGQIDVVWFGQYEAVLRTGTEYADRNWRVPKPAEPVDLVIATVGPTPPARAWQAIGTALEVACTLADKQSNVLVIAPATEDVGPTGQWLIGTENPWNIIAQLRESDAEDVISTSQISHAISSHRIHLMSGLPQEFIESLGVIPVNSSKEIERLIQRSTRYAIIEDADRARLEAPPKQARVSE